ncbi:hypothetical protein [Sphingomonas antarctica]|uniref:hypothetical protein n=1 Tax=Sphingomonas antarctica TaxID=2040274 RepID=UPI0039E860F8
MTHAPPQRETVAVELPAAVKRDLQLDRERSWIVCDEMNRFIWPGPDIRLLDNGQPYYGAIPDWLFAEVRTAFAAIAGRRAVKATPRSS